MEMKLKVASSGGGVYEVFNKIFSKELDSIKAKQKPGKVEELTTVEDLLHKHLTGPLKSTEEDGSFGPIMMLYSHYVKSKIDAEGNLRAKRGPVSNSDYLRALLCVAVAKSHNQNNIHFDYLMRRTFAHALVINDTLEDGRRLVSLAKEMGISCEPEWVRTVLKEAYSDYKVTPIINEICGDKEVVVSHKHDVKAKSLPSHSTAAIASTTLAKVTQQGAPKQEKPVAEPEPVPLDQECFPS